MLRAFPKKVTDGKYDAAANKWEIKSVLLITMVIKTYYVFFFSNLTFPHSHCDVEGSSFVLSGGG